MAQAKTEKLRLQQKAFAALAGCQRIRCANVMSVDGERVCRALSNKQVVFALCDAQGCANGVIVENGREIYIHFNGNIVTLGSERRLRPKRLGHGKLGR